MADIEFRINAGPYEGNYALDLGDITANDVGDLLAQQGPDLDAILVGDAAKGTRLIAALVWVVRRRGNRGLTYRAIADHITINIVEPVVSAGEAAVSPAGLVDPSQSGNG
jgi:hypothetical protein